ncbi:hypothetical protein PIIN_07035 [Serendipita indica DSM 11827]|uniref:Uncharacterized protein n=1 Tax=Serendipita indica (strain DSM 11827) TaxID=1109443 RepID=G4TP34_SERID|nr:hypothetical protein PIIN_07035 [Serendipita indica DSM 11827]
MPGPAKDGQYTPVAGQFESLTSTNSFTNFCLTQNVPSDSTQIRDGSCNVVLPMGRIMDKFPFAKFFSPFTVKFKIRNVKVGPLDSTLALGH